MTSISSLVLGPLAAKYMIGEALYRDMVAVCGKASAGIPMAHEDFALPAHPSGTMQ